MYMLNYTEMITESFIDRLLKKKKKSFKAFNQSSCHNISIFKCIINHPNVHIPDAAYGFGYKTQNARFGLFLDEKKTQYRWKSMKRVKDLSEFFMNEEKKLRVSDR